MTLAFAPGSGRRTQAYRCPCCTEHQCRCHGAHTTLTTCHCCRDRCGCPGVASPVVVSCDDHDTPATREVWWTESPRTADERGRTIAVCVDQECLDRALATVAYLAGELVSVEDLPTP